jgi:CRP/FNR family nitrogen fixation transcriptional regulator
MSFGGFEHYVTSRKPPRGLVMLATQSKPSFRSQPNTAAPGTARWLPPAGARGLMAFDLVGTVMNVAGNAEIYGESEPAEFLYKVRSGAVRTYKLLPDGRRQVGGFHLPGDLFGVAMSSAGKHCYSAEAIADSRILAVKRSLAGALAERHAEMASALWNQAALGLGRAGAHMILLGRKSAEERVGDFLLEMAERQGDPAEVRLPMSRQDIADYLGLTVETVSRTLALLEDQGKIHLHSARRIELLDPAGLETLDA